MDCLLCEKHEGRGKLAHPPGGYIYEDARWMVCHAPAGLGPLGTLFVESRRHFLDYAGMTPEESASLGEVLKSVYRALRTHTGAERIYQLSTIEGIPHYHCWLVPRRKEDVERSLKFLSRDDSCSEKDAAALATEIRKTLQS